MRKIAPNKFAACTLAALLAATCWATVHPVSSLPKYITPNAHEITLVADYDSRLSSGNIPVYLINQTSEPLTLAAQDGDVYLKLETQDDKGEWVRAQPHRYSWCGNSYFNPPELLPGHYLLIQGYQPVEGSEANIRYRFYGQEIEGTTNEGSGLYSDLDIAAATTDAMAVYEGSFEFVVSVATGETIIINESDHITDLQGLAMEVLGSGKFEYEATREALLKTVQMLRDKRTDAMRSIDRLDREHQAEANQQ